MPWIEGSAGPAGAPLLPLYEAGSAPRAGSIALDEVKADYAWHYHDMHKLIYAFEGAIELDVELGRHLVPLQLAAWIPAGVPHRLGKQNVRSSAIFFPAEAVTNPGQRVRTVLVSPLMREMMREAVRWHLPGPETSLRSAYFSVMAGLCGEWIANEADLFLPASNDPRLQKAIDYTASHADARALDICAVAGMSERSLRRHFKQDTGMSWDEYRRRRRLLEAIGLLGSTSEPVIEIAVKCGFESPSAFARAFRAALHESPSDYRRRVRTS